MITASTQPRTRPRREAYLVRLVGRADRRLARGNTASEQLSRWRLAIFLTGTVTSVGAYKLGWFTTGNVLLIVWLGLFLTVAAYHSRLEARMHRLRLGRNIKQAHLARLTVQWTPLPERPFAATTAHPYAADLDLIGSHSLLRLLDGSVTTDGHEALRDWLLGQTEHTLPLDRWRQRQALVRELASRPALRDRVHLEAWLAGDPEDERLIDTSRIRALLGRPCGVPELTLWLIVEGSLASVTLVLLSTSLWFGAPDYWMLSFLPYAIGYFLVSGSLAPSFGRALSLHITLNQVRAMCVVLERRSLTPTPELARVCAPLREGSSQASVRLRELARICHALSLRAHPLIHLLTNALVPWDLFFTRRLERVRHALETYLPCWLDVLSEVEAAASLATLAYLHPDYAWPTPLAPGPAGPVLRARALGHPLIPRDRRVTNDFELRGSGRILLITGSNMSGKSTFLRTVGINLSLAQAGGPVCAETFEWTWARPYCCIRVEDSLDSGLSFFYAEVKRLRDLLAATRDRTPAPVLFLIDEIFKGTNNRERLAGSREYIKALAATPGFGLVTTHDLELAELEREIPSASNAHFQESVANGSLVFDYRLRSGPCPTTNALKIMAMEGLPVPREVARPLTNTTPEESA